MWQDYVITGASILFSISLIPQVYQGFKERKGLITIATSLPTFIGLYAISITFFTLSLYISSITASLTATMWFTIFLQRLIYKKA